MAVKQLCVFQSVKMEVTVVHQMYVTAPQDMWVMAVRQLCVTQNVRMEVTVVHQTAPDVCDCATGYVGDSCQTAVCVPECQNGGTCSPECQNGGTCSAPNMCDCAG
jgi:hypothetical protein